MVSIAHKLIRLPATMSIFLPFVQKYKGLSGQINRIQDVAAAAAVDATVSASPSATADTS